MTIRKPCTPVRGVYHHKVKTEEIPKACFCHNVDENPNVMVAKAKKKYDIDTA